MDKGSENSRVLILGSIPLVAILLEGCLLIFLTYATGLTIAVCYLVLSSLLGFAIGRVINRLLVREARARPRDLENQDDFAEGLVVATIGMLCLIPGGVSDLMAVGLALPTLRRRLARSLRPLASTPRRGSRRSRHLKKEPASDRNH